MNESEIAQLCTISVRHGVASLSFDEVTTGRFVEGGAVFDVQSNEPPVRKNIDDLRTHPPHRMKASTVVSDEQAENAKPRLRSPLGRTRSEGDGHDLQVRSEGPPQTIIQPTAQAGVYFSPLFTVREADEEVLTQPQDQKDAKKGEKRRSPPEKSAESKTMNETFIIVRPPPSKSNHPLNLQVQLVPPQTPRVNYNKTYASSAETLVSAYDTSSTTSTLVSEREKGPRRIVPLYNLHAHNVITNTITDAGTDAKIAKFQKKGIELIDLAVFEPVEVWGEGSGSGKRQTKDQPMWVSVDDTGSVVLRPPNPSSKQDPPAPESSETRNPSTNRLSQPQLDDSPPPHQRQVQSPASLSLKPSTLRTEHNKPPLLAGGSNAAAPQLLKRFSAVRRWLSTNKGLSPQGVDQRMGEVPEVPPGESGRVSLLLPTVKCSSCHRPVPLSELGDHICTAPPPVPAPLIAGEVGKTIQERTAGGVTKVSSRPDGTDADTVDPTGSTVGGSSLVEDLTSRWQLRPPILGTQARYVSVSRPQTQESMAVNLGLEIIGEGGDVFTDGKGPATVKNALLSTGKGNKGLKAGSIFDGASVISGTSSMTLVESALEDFAAQDKASGNERAEMYIWLAVKWFKKRSDPPRPKWNLQPNLAFGPRVGGSFDVRFEWARARTKARASGRVGGKDVQAPVAGDDDGDDEDDGEHPEDSETPWVCTLKVRKIGDAQSHSSSNTAVGGRVIHTPLDITGDYGTKELSEVSSGEEGEKGTMLRLKVGVLSPTPHHPKVVAMLKVPYPLPDVEVERMTLVKREGLGRGDHSEAHLGLTLSAEEIKDIVCCTGLWLVVRETMGGVGKGVRKGDGWRIRE
ncbi:hypothetical protein FA13DRAFT_1733725 [Coprinellus micaceus]|uniref:Uncharacterized protein n=1 Tax=Coprinellus micaceus TaxID=71717 RepID=A0A4Y7T8Y6_COPMI|nr:hypothetical protein FA13DRAFT_1733725 [Coprinellus micaceus]